MHRSNNNTTSYTGFGGSLRSFQAPWPTAQPRVMTPRSIPIPSQPRGVAKRRPFRPFRRSPTPFRYTAPPPPPPRQPYTTVSTVEFKTILRAIIKEELNAASVTIVMAQPPPPMPRPPSPVVMSPPLSPLASLSTISSPPTRPASPRYSPTTPDYLKDSPTPSPKDLLRMQLF